MSVPCQCSNAHPQPLWLMLSLGRDKKWVLGMGRLGQGRLQVPLPPAPVRSLPQMACSHGCFSWSHRPDSQASGLHRHGSRLMTQEDSQNSGLDLQLPTPFGLLHLGHLVKNKQGYRRGFPVPAGKRAAPQPAPPVLWGAAVLGGADVHEAADPAPQQVGAEAGSQEVVPGWLSLPHPSLSSL